MTPPSVCIVAHAHPDFSKGGGEIAAYRQHRTLLAGGWRSTFVAAVELPGGQMPGDRGASVARYGEDEHLYAVSGMEEDRLWWRQPGERRALLDLLVGLKADVYHFHHYWRVGLDLVAALAEARPEARLVLTAHEMLAICAHHGQMVRTRFRELCRKETAQRCLDCYPDATLERMRLRKAMLLAGLRRFHRHVFPSHFVAERHAAWGLDPAAGTVLENYLGDGLWDLPRPDPTGAATDFAFFGRPTEFKGLDVLVVGFAIAARDEPRLRLAVHGATAQEALGMFPELAEPLAACGDRVGFSGRYDGADVLGLMAAAGWVVLPSVWWENSPVVIQEARLAGVPTIVSGIGGMAEKVADRVDGLHFRVGSATDLARVLRIAAVPANRARLAAGVAPPIGRDAFLDALRGIYAADVTGAAGSSSPTP